MKDEEGATALHSIDVTVSHAPSSFILHPSSFLTDGDLRLRPPRRDEAALYSRWWRDEEVQFGLCYQAAGARLGGVRLDVMSWRGETVCFRELYFLREDFEVP